MSHGRVGVHAALEAEQGESEGGVKHDRKMQVRALCSGTVIDHLRAGTALRTVRILFLDEGENTVLVGLNLKSAKLGAKDLIKVEGRELTQDEINQIALISPQATLCIIRDYEVHKKITPQLPDIIDALVRCVNPSCVSQDPRQQTRFRVENRVPLKLRCYFCERTFRHEELDLL